MEEKDPLHQKLATVVGIKIRGLGEIKKACADGLALKTEDHVILELDGDLTFGIVCAPPQSQLFTPPMRVMKSVLRKATEQEEITIAHQKKLSRDGIDFCRKRALGLGLHMKLIEVFGSFQRRVLTFRYTSENRVDFRQLVKDLARHFRCRIEMQQVSTREEAGRLSGVDTCGLILCCASFLTDFKSINLKLARTEWAWSNESHRIGVCGQLKCCLLFEQDEWYAPPQELIHPIRS